MTLIPRLTIINACAFAALVWAWQIGYVTTAFKADTSGISYIIAALLAVGLASAAWRAWAVSGHADLETSHRAYRAAQLPAKNAHLTSIATWLAALGMFGTVVGLIQMAFSLRGMDLGNAANLSNVLSVAFEGYGVALVTTAVGLVAGVWIEVNALLINTATELLIKETAQ